MVSTLRKRILIGYGIALALMAVVVVWAVVNLVGLGQAGDAILRENYKSILAAENMVGAIERQDSATLLVMLDYGEEGLRQFRENENQFLQWLGRAKDNVTISGEADIVASIESGYSAYLVDFSRLRQVRVSSPQQAGVFYHETVLPSFRHVRDEVERLRQINQNTMFIASRRAETVARTAIWSTVAVAAAAIGLGLAFSLLLSKRLVRPIRQMMEATEALSGGDYDVQVPASGYDELARLAESFTAMARKLGSYHRMNVDRILAEKLKGDAVLRSIEDGVVVVDAEFRVTNMNPQAGHMLGVDPEAAVAEKHFLEVVRDERLFELMKQTAKSGRPPKVEEGRDIISIGQDESARHYMFGITPVIAKGGRMLGVVLLLRDVTRLKELDRLKSEFVMTASHELKTPLQSLGMSIELLREGAAERLDARQRQLLDAAGEELARLKSLISDLLDLSKIEAGKVLLETDRIAPRLLADKAVGVFQAQARGKNIELTSDVPDDVPEIRADANKITWVLTNLIANALRYAESRVAVSARHSGQWVRFSVADDGEGIPTEYQSRIFDKFVQVKSEKSVGGTGLGLAICKEIVRAHKGTIWVDSTPGEGSTFTFTLPVAQYEEGECNGSL
jgi:NtrC-family two-component system sensor histidine kinase KinB